MEKRISILIIISLLMTGCKYIPAPLPTPTSPETGLSDTPDIADTELPVITSTPIPTATSVVSPYPEDTITPSPVPLPTTIPTALPITIQFGSPAFIQNFAHTDANCNWSGVAGQVFDAANNPVNNLVINVKGKLGQADIDKVAVTGIPEANVYGPGGYEIKFADQVLESAKTLSIQVFDLNGKSLSTPISFNTYNDCEKNLIIINFQMK